MATPTSTVPNVVIEDPSKRRKYQAALNTLLLLVAVGSLFFGVFPEAAFGTDIPTRIALFLNSAVTLVAAFYGITVTRPNTPKF